MPRLAALAVVAAVMMGCGGDEPHGTVLPLDRAARAPATDGAAEDRRQVEVLIDDFVTARRRVLDDGAPPTVLRSFLTEEAADLYILDAGVQSLLLGDVRRGPRSRIVMGEVDLRDDEADVELCEVVAAVAEHLGRVDPTTMRGRIDVVRTDDGWRIASLAALATPRSGDHCPGGSG